MVSVITPVYNSEQYLDRCIQSILNQTYKDIEVLLVDDGSTDGSGQICDGYQKIDNRVIVIHQENAGQACARNKALDFAKGEYICFVDSDDFIHPKMIEELVLALSQNDADIVLFDFVEGTETKYKWNNGKANNTVYNSREFLRNSIIDNKKGIWVLCDKIFKRECFNNIRLPEGRIYEDNATVYKLLYDASKIVYVEKIYYYYFTNLNSTTKQEFSEKYLDWLTVLDEMSCFFYDKNDFEVYDSLVKRYLNESSHVYFKTKKCFPKSPRLKDLKSRIKYYYKTGKKRLGIGIKNYPLVYKVIYPIYYYAFRIAYVVKRKLISQTYL